MSISDEEASAATSSDENERESRPTTKVRRPTHPGKRSSMKDTAQSLDMKNLQIGRTQTWMNIPDFKPKPFPRKPQQSTREPVLEEKGGKSLFKSPFHKVRMYKPTLASLL